MDPITILSAFAPVVMDLGKSLINKFVAPDQFKPATIEQYSKMKEIDLEFFKVMNDAGGGVLERDLGARGLFGEIGRDQVIP